MNTDQLIQFLQLFESEINVNKQDSINIVNLFEYNDKKYMPPKHSERPDLMELDASTKPGDVYDISKRKENDSDSDADKNDENEKNELNKDNNVKNKEIELNSDKKSKEESNSDNSNDNMNKSESSKMVKSLVDYDVGYPEIKINSTLKNATDESFSNILKKSEVDYILSISEDKKEFVFRNIILIKSSDLKSGEEYDCFNSNKVKNVILTKGKIKKQFLEMYYRFYQKIKRPDTGEYYSVFLSKNTDPSSTLKELTYLVSLSDNNDKFPVVNERSEKEKTIIIFNKNEFDLLFHFVD